MPTSTQSAAKLIASKVAYGVRAMSTTMAASATLTAMPQYLTKIRGENRLHERWRNNPLPPGAAILCIGALSVIGWVVILVSILVLV